MTYTNGIKISVTRCTIVCCGKRARRMSRQQLKVGWRLGFMLTGLSLGCNVLLLAVSPQSDNVRFLQSRNVLFRGEKPNEGGWNYE